MPRGQLAPALPSGIPQAQDRQLIDLWLSTKISLHTRRAYAFEVQRFQSYTPKPLASITLSDLQDWTASLSAAALKPATLNRAVTAIKSLFSFAHRTGYLAYNVGAVVPAFPLRNELSRRILSEEQISALLQAAASGRNRVILRLLYASGIRVSELCGLRWQDLQERPGGGQIAVHGKGGRTRAVLLPASCWQAVQALRTPTALPADPVFRSRRGGSLDSSQVRRIVYAAARKAGMATGVSPHWMRHAHASHALDRQAPIHLVQATLGHISITTTGRYLHARPNQSSGLYLRDPEETPT